MKRITLFMYCLIWAGCSFNNPEQVNLAPIYRRLDSLEANQVRINDLIDSLINVQTTGGAFAIDTTQESICDTLVVYRRL